MAGVKEFKDLIELNEYVTKKIEMTGLTSETFRFYADVVRANNHSTGLYIDVSQPYTAKNGTRNIEITVYVPRYLAPKILEVIKVSNVKELVGKKWIFQGRLSFFRDRMSFTFYADTIAPMGESEIEKRRKEILKELEVRNLLMKEKHDLSELPPIKKIAIITSKSAAGYEDFLKNLTVHYLYRPIVHLYESPMQGAQTASGIILALNRIRKSNIDYDVVVIARGGGARSDLMYFDDLSLGIEIAKFNEYCPILSGIGHERDFTIPDYVAWKRFATPTEVARAISKQIEDNVKKLDDSYNDLRILLSNVFKIYERTVELGLIDYMKKVIESDFIKIVKDLDETYEKIENFVSYKINDSSQRLSEDFLRFMSNSLENKLKSKKDSVENFEKILERDISILLSNKETMLNETFQELLKREEFAPLLFGGALVMKSGHFVKSIRQMKIGDKLDLYLKDGKVKTKVVAEKKIKKEELYGGHTLFRS